MKQFKFLTLIVFILSSSCSKSPNELLKQAQIKILNNKTVSYKQEALYPNPMGKITTIKSTSLFHKNRKSLTGYDFILKTKNRADNIYINGVYKSVEHKEGNVVILPNQIDDEKKKLIIKDNVVITYSPITLLNQSDWKFVKDTIFEGNKLSDYFVIENDEVVDGNTVYTEQHIFIDHKTELLKRWERRNYFKGKLNQVVTYNYLDYSFDVSENQLSYNFPLNGQENKRKLLKVGEKAPLFSGKSLQNKVLKLKDFLGKKILLSFSVIHCGACYEALKHMNKKGYQLLDNISFIYINPDDEKEDVIEYTKKINVPFSAIYDAKKIKDAYGVQAYPTFFLIDEKGVIEKVVQGYDENFLESLRK